MSVRTFNNRERADDGFPPKARWTSIHQVFVEIQMKGVSNV